MLIGTLWKSGSIPFANKAIVSAMKNTRPYATHGTTRTDERYQAFRVLVYTCITFNGVWMTSQTKIYVKIIGIQAICSCWTPLFQTLR